ncbi:uncharacterized protein BYT42DRAFT_129348 [Radiomyces spectabilis]|uniref:uncharacterized protein n=1 Tax=Radiomyces spectabilis TaxID=64574 RepID=UPI00221E37F0|nr:uncharacterized protein BYT42DRAFT_129348 [Radiomyces spectabilis]KAI8367522.1 hypothetical protein BYT42DRAFT_129348 [Radiomyces spectabilis]
MHILVGVVLAFWLGYLTASRRILEQILEEKRFIYVILALGTFYAVIFIGLKRIVEADIQRNPSTSFRTSAREHLQRRGSF